MGIVMDRFEPPPEGRTVTIRREVFRRTDEELEAEYEALREATRNLGRVDERKYRLTRFG